jgi:hypothetical protein
MAKEEKKSQKDLALDYFITHSTKDAPIDSILMTDDGLFFYNTVKGLNNCINYCGLAKVGYKEFKNEL